mmetsp:Transcript_19147/g.54056  ORF Transcript_19147/g.54056 Transcript_19147/m.54056 type:complete len:214 (+) Transcript_19147:464-1105(+)
MRSLSSLRFGLWSIVSASTCTSSLAPFFLMMTPRLSPTCATVRVFSSNWWYTSVQVVPLVEASTPGFVRYIWVVTKESWKALPGLSERWGWLRKVSRRTFLAKLDTSWPAGPCPSNTPYRANWSSTTRTEKLSWLGDSGFLPFLQTHSTPRSLSQSRMSPSAVLGGRRTSSSLSWKLGVLAIFSSVTDVTETALFPPTLAEANTFSNPASFTS